MSGTADCFVNSQQKKCVFVINTAKPVFKNIKFKNLLG